MKTILVTHHDPQGNALKLTTTQSFLVDRPMLLHCVEQLLAAKQRDLIVLHAPNDQTSIELLGDGSRWGCRIEHQPVERVRTATWLQRWSTQTNESHVLIGHACRWLKLTQEVLETQPDEPLDLRFDGAAQEVWSGWTRLPIEWLQDLPQAESWESFGEQIATTASRLERYCSLGIGLSSISERSLVSAQQQVLSGACPSLVLYGRERQPGVRQCRNVRLHRTARVHGPALIGDDVWIGKNVEIGPGTVIGHGSVIDRGTRLHGSLVMPGTLVGCDLNIEQCWVDQHRVLELQSGSEAASAVWNFTAAV